MSEFDQKGKTKQILAEFGHFIASPADILGSASRVPSLGMSAGEATETFCGLIENRVNNYIR